MIKYGDKKLGLYSELNVVWDSLYLKKIVDFFQIFEIIRFKGEIERNIKANR